MVEDSSAKPLSVALVIDPLTFSRLGPVIGHLSIGLLDYVSQITLITEAPAALRLSLGPVQVIHHRHLGWPMWTRGVREILERFGARPPSIFHAMSSRSLHLADTLAQHTARPLVAHLLGSEDTHASLQPFFERTRMVIAGSEPLLATARSRQLVDPNAIALIRPGLLPETAPTCFLDPNLIATILCMSALERSTGVDHLLQAMKTLRDEGHEVMLFAVAEGPDEMRFRRQVEQLNLIEQVTFGQPIANWTKAMLAADLFVVPGDVDRVDVRLLHAMAAGMAAVTGSMPNSDFVIHEQTSLVCPTPSGAALADAIRLLLTRRTLARKLAASALEHCRKHHSLSKMTEQTADVYTRVHAAWMH